MDETQQNKTSEAAATRKRRSSILKSQRPPRTPFSELEFNVATPDNTTKSRRVSFSRRTGVAEFVTNEATTTWKNFYEEHNKSLESSANESEANAPRPPIGHLGKRIFDQQFEEVDAVDFLTSLDTHSNRNVSSLNNINFTEQLASLECSTNAQLPIPSNNFELSAFTDHHSKVFGDDLAIPAMGEMSGRIDINFSAMQTMCGDDKDDLDEIERDLQNNKNNVVGPDCFKGGRDMSEYIEVDLNMTHVNLRNQESDMSITDTIHSPKVQEVSKTNSSQIDIKASLSKDWVLDKENIAINPYVMPKESVNFAINDESDKVLVFDGKRLTLQCGKEADAALGIKENSQILSDKPKRKTVVININDDLPNFGEVSSLSLSKNAVSKHSVVYDDINLSMTQALPSKLATNEKRKTIVYDEHSGNISVTQAVPHNIILPDKNDPSPEKRTVIYQNDTCNISITQAVSSNIIIPTAKQTTEKPKTIVYNEDTNNISITQALPTNIMSQDRTGVSNKRNTIIYDSDVGDISMTQAISAAILGKDTAKNKTLNYDNDACDISMTQAILSNLILPNKSAGKRRTVVFENDTGNISMTQAIPTNIILSNVEVPEASKSIVYFDDKGDISVTQAVPSKLLLPKAEIIEKRRTIVYEDDTGNISVTQTVPSNIVKNKSKTLLVEEEKIIIVKPHVEQVSDNITVSDNLSRQPPPINEKRRTIVFENDDGDISMTQMIPTDIPMPRLVSEKQSIINVENNVLYESNTTHNQTENKRRTIVYENDTGNISVTQAIPTHIILSNNEKIDSETIEVVCDNELKDKTTQAISNNPLQEQNEFFKKSMLFNDAHFSMTDTCSKNKEKADVKRRTVVFDADSDNAEMSITVSVPHNFKENSLEPEKRKTIVFLDETSDLSMTKPIPAKLMSVPSETLNKSKIDRSNLDLHTKQSFYEKSALNLTSQDIFVYQAATIPSSPISQLGTESDSNPEEPVDNCDKVSLKVNKPAGFTSCATVLADDIEEAIKEVLTQPFADTHERKCNEINNQLLSSTINPESNDKPNEDVIKFVETETKVVLNNLLDMSDASMELGLDDKNVMTEINSEHPSRDSAGKRDTESNSDMFLAVKDTDEGIQTVDDLKHIYYNMEFVESRKSLIVKNELPRIDKTKPTIEYKEEKITENGNELQKSISEVKEEEHVCPLTNRHYEKIVSPDLNKKKEFVNKSHKDQLDVSKYSKSFREADSTKELLEMLSDFTDPQSSSDKVEEENPRPVKANLENRTTIIEPRPLSVAPSRQSIVLSREDLLNNISMAQAALQMSLEIDESDNIDDSSNTPIDECTPPNKSVRVSNEVVKTLHFEDESINDNINKSEIRMSPLKKTAFNETSDMNESKAKVIPTYLKDVSDGIKELMTDLMKPMADYEMIRIDNSLKKSLSTCSTQIQANLITSSQIEMDLELCSNTESDFNLTKPAASNKSDLDKTSYKSPIKPKHTESQMVIDVDNYKEISFRPKRTSVEESSKVLVFDHENPLNNVLLVPADCSDVHKYNPRKSNEICSTNPNQSYQDSKELQMESVSIHQKVENVNMLHSIKKTDDILTGKVAETESTISNISKPMSIDESIDVKLVDVKHTEVNTLIAMKENKELLDASSSLTLVDNQAHSSIDIDLDKPTNEMPKRKSRSPVKVIYKTEQQSHNIDLDESNDETEPMEIANNSKKRNYSLTKYDKQKSTLPLVDVTPKPASKIQKLSGTPNTLKNTALDLSAEKLHVKVEKDESTSDVAEMNLDSKTKSTVHIKSPRRTKISPKSKKLSTISVEQLMTEYNIDPKVDQKLNVQILQALSKTESSVPHKAQSDAEGVKSAVESFISSKDQISRVREQDGDMPTDDRSSWKSESQSEYSFMSDCDSGANIVAKIDMLPFMGTQECEWESSGTDTWSFRLLHGRVRLIVRLGHRHHNATRTQVRADTPVLGVEVESVHHGNDKKNSVAALCVHLAVLAMRGSGGECARAGRAGGVPALVGRCARVARRALRWGRVLQAAHMHLAFSVQEDEITLKVANIPLRCVWEVSLPLELATGPAGEPYPRAGLPRVRCLLTERAPPERELRRLLVGIPEDWGHVPRTVWKIFKYLKCKTQDEYLLGV